MFLWRIAADTRRYAADDLSGAAAAAHPGRWNDDGQAVIYAAPTLAMAVLETAAHIDDAGLPLNRYVLRIQVPDEVWAARVEVDLASLPPTWSAIPAGRGSVSVGRAWLSAKRSALLLVPSVIVPEERVALLNPAHPAAKRCKATIVREFNYRRLLRLG